MSHPKINKHNFLPPDYNKSQFKEVVPIPVAKTSDLKHICLLKKLFFPLTRQAISFCSTIFLFKIWLLVWSWIDCHHFYFSGCRRMVLWINTKINQGFLPTVTLPYSSDSLNLMQYFFLYIFSFIKESKQETYTKHTRRREQKRGEGEMKI